MGVKTIGRLLNPTTTTFDANQNITFTNNTFSSSAIGYDGDGGILLKSPGTYLVIANFTALATVADTDASIVMEENGTAATGAMDMITLTDIGDFGHLSIADVITVKPQCGTEIATLAFNNVAAVSIRNASVIVMRIV